MDLTRKVAIVSDHAGAELRQRLVKLFNDHGEELFAGWELIDLSPNVVDNQPVDYPDYAHILAESVLTNSELVYGIAICGSGQGMNMVLNGSCMGIRSALAWNPEIARLSRAHNNAEFLCLPARFISVDEALEIIKIFLETSFEGGRHQRRVAKIQKAN